MTVLEKLSNTAVIVVATVVLGMNLYDRFSPKVPAAQTSLNSQYFGKRLPLADGIVNGRNGTVTLFISKDCHFCSESMDFYRHLAELGSTPSCRVKIVALGPQNRETRDDVQGYLASHGLSVDALEMVDFPSVNVHGTPTLVVHDSAQLVRGVWVGKLSETVEKQVIARVQGLCPKSS